MHETTAAEPSPSEAPSDPSDTDPAEDEPLAARDHTCATLFGDEQQSPVRASVGDDEECFRDPDTQWLWQLAFAVGVTREAAWDDSLAARGYGPSDVLFGGETTLLRRLGWLGLGLRTSVRDLRWVHFERPAASIFGWDLMVAANARVSIGQRKMVSLGLDAAGGVGLAWVSLNGARDTEVGWRLQAGAELAIAVVGPAALFVRVSYDAFPVNIGDMLDAQLGGARFTLGFEVRE